MKAHERHPHRRRMSPAVRWFLANTLIAGFFALCWLILRSGSKPSRLAYPCQQAAFTTASLAFGAPLVSLVIALRRRIAAGLLTPQGIAIVLLAVVATFGLWGTLTRTDAYSGPVLSPSADYRAQVFDETGCSKNPVGDHLPCLDDLIEKMGGHGLKFFKSDTASLTAGPEGIVASDDVVVVKINYQWPERGGTNTDLLRGVIRRIVDHPDGFTGEVVVCENAQFNSTSNFDRPENNAKDHSLSPHDVVVGFQSQGYKVSQFDWTTIRYSSVTDYHEGNQTDGYVVYDYDASLGGRISYPKFTTAYGTRISLKNGIPKLMGYDRERLKFINLPVLKSHHATYGATAMVKHYMGVVTGELSTNSHSAIGNGLMGALMGEIQLADLNILDAIWVNANPNDGPWTTYEGATRLDRLVASKDPVAGDLWAVKNILIPAFLDNGYTPPWPYPSADPDLPTSSFRNYLDTSMYQLLAAGYEVTNDPAQIDSIDLAPPGEASQPGGGGAQFTMGKSPDGYDLSWSGPVRGGPVGEYRLYRTNLMGHPGMATPLCEASMGADTSQVLDTLPDNHGFIVVATNSVGDGSFGSNSHGFERPSPPSGTICP